MSEEIVLHIQRDYQVDSFDREISQEPTQKIAYGQSQLSSLKAEIYQIQSNNFGSKIEIDKKTFMGLIQKISVIENIYYEVMQDL